MPCQTADRPEVPFACSSRTKANFPSDRNTPLTDSNRPVSRRSKPSSRSPLIGEQPHPWPLLHGQDGKNRHRGSKPPGRYVLLPVTTLLSPGQLFCHLTLSPRELRGSLSLTFVLSPLAMRGNIRLTYAFTLFVGFPTQLSQPQGALDIFSRAWRPTQTAHLPRSSSQSQGGSSERVVFQGRLHSNWRPSFDVSYLCSTIRTTTQRQAAVKLHGVFTSHQGSPDSALERKVHRVPARDSGTLIDPFMQAANQAARYYATLRGSLLPPPLTGPSSR
eukprot:TRINITY_DN423_c0_g1_i5.p2 TRINITY_DN423_c0_g1~~TRINITY_DN423_c0_g1_i5.p2  ORF type:complete len:275 (-),score=-94.99 TRINITY_DN423_c0_g1_i5:102-926(-)